MCQSNYSYVNDFQKKNLSKTKDLERERESFFTMHAKKGSSYFPETAIAVHVDSHHHATELRVNIRNFRFITPFPWSIETRIHDA